MNLMLIAAVSYQLSVNLPLKHDGYVVEREVDQEHSLSDDDCRMSRDGQQAYNSKHCERFVVKAATERAFLYANYESNRWMNAKSYPFVRDPHFAFRALDVGRSPEPLRDWIAATGANAVYLKRGRLDAKLLRECAELGVPAYGFIYGCDAAKWNREKYDAFIAAHPSAKGVTPPKSWEKGTLCPSDPATREFFKDAILEIAGERRSRGDTPYRRRSRGDTPYRGDGRAGTPCPPSVAGVVVCLWDDYGLNCVCDRCRANGMAGNWGRQVAFAVKAWEEALNPLGKELIVRTWASGASHWLRDEWVHAPGYGGPSGDPLSVWGDAMKSAGAHVRFQTKVYNSDCQPDPPFSALLPVAPRKDIAEWQITGQTVGLQYLPASVVDQTTRQFRRVAGLVPREGGVMLYAGAYRRTDGYAALSDDLNSVNLHVWRQLSWNPDDDVDSLWREWAEMRFGPNIDAIIAAMKATERATVAAFSPLGLGAPTESYFANSVPRRESLLRYTNRYFLPEGKAALAPTLANVTRILAEKDSAIKALDRECSQIRQLQNPVGTRVPRVRGHAGRVTLPNARKDLQLPQMANGSTVQKSEIQMRFGWLRAHLEATRALDGALWRYFYLRELAKHGETDLDVLAEIDADFDEVRRLCTSGALCAPLGSPASLMRDIRNQAQDVSRSAQQQVRYRGARPLGR